ncbi:MAG: DUF4892 domain-containing protein [Myxococcota bacterium]
MSNRAHVVALVAVLLMAVPIGAVAEKPDARGSSDHPVLTRYPGSRIQVYKQVDFDRYPLALGVEKNAPARVQPIEGRVTKIGYVNPSGRSAFEIYRNYEDALRKAGFEKLWSCEAGACGRAMNWNALNGLTASGGPNDIRYLVARAQARDQVVTVAMAVNTTGTTVHIVESKAMDTGLVTASAAELAAGIERDGHMSVYDLHFDPSRAELRPESKASLDEIARLLRERPTLELLVVGHTDATGGLEMNMKLSADRAASVVRALTTDYGIAPARLAAHGAGPLAPVASNRSEQGRAANRRVDLVER